MLWQLLGLVLSAAGIAALYHAWKRKGRSWPLVLTGWALLFGAVLAWGRTSGIDKGPALGIIVVVLTGLVALAVLGTTAPAKQQRAPRAVAAGPAPSASGWRGGIPATLSVLTIVLVGLAVCVVACTALFMGNRALGMEHTANLTLTMFSLPTLWGALATFIGYSESRSGRAMVLAGITAASACVLVLTMQGV